MYNYLECPKCHARRAFPVLPHGAIAFPLCENPDCGRTFLRFLARGQAPFAAPPPPAIFGVPPALGNVDRQVHGGAGENHGYAVEFTVTENEAMDNFKIQLFQGIDFKYPAIFPRSCVHKAGILPEYWCMNPPFRLEGQAPGSWLTLDTGSDQFDRLGGPVKQLAYAAVLPRVLEVRMLLGTEKFGLIHFLLGHTKNMRNFIGTENPAFDAADEGYRTIQGVQRGLALCFAPAKIKGIYYGAANWVLWGDGAKLVISRTAAGFFYIVTLFQTDQEPKDECIWKRRR